jgi:hypothetical protein
VRELWPDERVLWSQRPDARGALMAQLQYASRQAREAMRDSLELRNAAGVILSPFVFALAWLRYLWPVEIIYFVTTQRVLTIHGGEVSWLALGHCAEPRIVRHEGEVGSILFPHDADQELDLRFDGIRGPESVVELWFQTFGLPMITFTQLDSPVVLETTPNSPAEFDDGHYGRGTARIGEIVRSGRGITWFPRRGPADAAEQALVTGHLESLAASYPGQELATRPIVWLTGDLGDFDRSVPALGLTDGDWGDPWSGTTWGRLLVALHLVVLARIERDAATLDLVGPPLWPLPRRINLVGVTLCESPPPPELRSEARWAMMSHVQHNYWRAVEWALLWPEHLARSPFYSLYQLHLAGLYPVGFDDAGAFRVYYRSTTPG